MPGLLADIQTEEVRWRLLAIGATVRRAFAELLSDAVARGEIPAGVDAPFLFDLLSGATTMRGLTRGDEYADSFIESLSSALYVLASADAASEG